MDVGRDLRRQRMIASCFWIMQTIGALVVLVDLAVSAGNHQAWERAIMPATLLAMCCLTAAATVMGTPRFWIRTMVGSLIIAGGPVLLDLTEAVSMRRKPNVQELLVVVPFALALWSVIQLPFWIARYVLAARVLTVSASATSQESRHQSQYGIRQLILLTFAVSLILGIFRWLLPQQAIQFLHQIKAVTWVLLGSIAIALAMVAVTTTLSTLNPIYWRMGAIASAVSSLLIAWAVFWITASIWKVPIDAYLFGGMILWTYAWLQLSVLLVRGAGYRIVVRG